MIQVVQEFSQPPLSGDTVYYFDAVRLQLEDASRTVGPEPEPESSASSDLEGSTPRADRNPRIDGGRDRSATQSRSEFGLGELPSPSTIPPGSCLSDRVPYAAGDIRQGWRRMLWARNQRRREVPDLRHGTPIRGAGGNRSNPPAIVEDPYTFRKSGAGCGDLAQPRSGSARARAAICSQMALRLGGGDEVGTPLIDFSSPTGWQRYEQPVP